jgi:hypothetical protein
MIRSPSSEASSASANQETLCLLWSRKARINKNLFHEEIDSGFHSGNACYHSAQNHLSSRLLSKNIKIKIKNTILPVGFNGRETWSLMLREGHRLRVFEKRVPRRIFDRRGMR